MLSVEEVETLARFHFAATRRVEPARKLLTETGATFMLTKLNMTPAKTAPLTTDDLFKMTQVELDDLFVNSQVGPIPDGEAKGTAIIAPGTTYSKEIASIINHFAWQGKTFDGKRGVLTNRILLFGLNAIVAEVYKDTSWLDGKECIVLDYSKTSIAAQWIRDEIREIGPGFYLGKVYWERKRLIDFCLEFPAAAA